jgi:hypothetical protein
MAGVLKTIVLTPKQLEALQYLMSLAYSDQEHYLKCGE